MADKPKLASVVEGAIRLRHRMGASEDELIEEAQGLTGYIFENFFMDNEGEEMGVLERKALEKLGMPMALRCAKRYIKNVLAG